MDVNAAQLKAIEDQGFARAKALGHSLGRFETAIGDPNHRAATCRKCHESVWHNSHTIPPHDLYGEALKKSCGKRIWR